MASNYAPILLEEQIRQQTRNLFRATVKHPMAFLKLRFLGKPHLFTGNEMMDSRANSAR
jgi:hypothetical protein